MTMIDTRTREKPLQGRVFRMLVVTGLRFEGVAQWSRMR